MGKSQQRKGKVGELELVEIFKGYGFKTERGESQSYGGVPDIIGLPGIHIEVKRQERLNVPDAMEQAIRDSLKFRDGLPAVFHRRNRQPWLITMRLDDWIRIYKKALSKQNSSQYERR